MRSRWQVTTDPHRVIVTGSSAGGLGAAYVALEKPELFGNVLSQSGAFWRGAEASNDAPYEWLTTQVTARPRADIRFYMDVGEYEDHATLGGSGPIFSPPTADFATRCSPRAIASPTPKFPRASTRRSTG